MGLCRSRVSVVSFDISRYLVLLAHPDRHTRTRLQAMLQAADIDAVLVADGMQAWRALDATPEHYDAVLLDHGLSGMSAIEIVRRLRDCAATAALPALFVDGADLAGPDAPPDDAELLGALKVAIEDYRSRFDRAS